MSIFQLTKRDFIPPHYDAIIELTGDYKDKFPDHVMVETYRGRVITEFEKNGYDDSDFIATVWNDNLNKPIDVMYATTRGWTYLNNAEIDASDAGFFDE